MAKKGSSGSDSKKAGLFESWLTMFTSMVFLQSFHAVFLMFILKLISQVQQTTTTGFNSDMISTVVAIAGITGLIKLEPLIRDVFGIKETKAGSLASNFYKTTESLKSGGQMIGRTAQPFMEASGHRKNRIELAGKIGEARNALTDATAQAAPPAPTGGTSGIRMTGGASPGTNGAGAPIVNPQGISLVNADGNAIDRNGNVIPGVAATAGPTSAGGNSGIILPGGANTNRNINAGGIANNNNNANISGLNDLNANISRLNNTVAQNNNAAANANTENATTKVEEAKRNLTELQSQFDRERIEEGKSLAKGFLRTGSTITTTSMAFGATEDLSHAVAAANVFDKPLDAMSDKLIDNIVKGVSKGTDKGLKNSANAWLNSGPSNIRSGTNRTSPPRRVNSVDDV